MSEIQLQYRALRINVSADCESDLLWLRDFLGPSYRPIAEMPACSATPAGTARRVGLHADPRWTERREIWEREAAAGKLGRVLVHVMDGTDLHLPCITQADGTLLAWDERRFCFYHHPAADLTSILHRPGAPSSGGGRLAWMRGVRELALHHELRAGSLALHAAGLVKAGRAVLFAGPRRAGKTTLLSACLGLVPDLQLLANDRVMISLQGQLWRCRGMATVVSVRPGSDHLLPGLHRRLLAHALGSETGPDEPGSRAFRSEDRLLLSPGQFSRGLGVSMAAESALASIVLPRIDAETDGLQFERIPPEQASTALGEALFGTAHPHSRSQLFDLEDAAPFPDQKERISLVLHLAATVPCFSLVVGRDAYQSDLLSELLNKLLTA